jgi:hypothetical protein
MVNQEKNIYKDVEDYFAAPPTYNEKVIGIIVDLEHKILTLAEEAHIEDIVRKRLQEKESEIRNLITEILGRPHTVKSFYERMSSKSKDTRWAS